MVGVGEVALGVESLGDGRMVGELLAVVIGERVDKVGLPVSGAGAFLDELRPLFYSQSFSSIATVLIACFFACSQQSNPVVRTTPPSMEVLSSQPLKPRSTLMPLIPTPSSSSIPSPNKPSPAKNSSPSSKRLFRGDETPAKARQRNSSLTGRCLRCIGRGRKRAAGLAVRRNRFLGQPRRALG